MFKKRRLISSMKFSKPVIQSRMRLLVFRGEETTATLLPSDKGEKGFVLVWGFFCPGTDLGNWKQRWKTCAPGGL